MLGLTDQDPEEDGFQPEEELDDEELFSFTPSDAKNDTKLQQLQLLQ